MPSSEPITSSPSVRQVVTQRFQVISLLCASFQSAPMVSLNEQEVTVDHTGIHGLPDRDKQHERHIAKEPAHPAPLQTDWHHCDRQRHRQSPAPETC